MDGGLTPGRRAAWVAVGVLAVVAAVGWYLAIAWHGRATRAEDGYREVQGWLTSTEGDVSTLTERQRDLSAEKAQIEDDRAALAAEKGQLEANQQELQKALGIVQQIAVAYQNCSSGYVAVIRDLDASRVTAETQKNLDGANASCQAATRMIQQLPVG
ncbi:MAG: hypothetical protein U0U69_01940 [Acidimicrobiia bacterium]